MHVGETKFLDSDYIVSLDVESLFTNVPIIEIIYIILKEIYENKDKSLHNIEKTFSKRTIKRVLNKTLLILIIKTTLKKMAYRWDNHWT